MPHKVSSTKEHNHFCRLKDKARGYVHGPRISDEAAYRLGVLSRRHLLTPREVVTRLILGIPLEAVSPSAAECLPFYSDSAGEESRRSFQARERMSDSEMREFDAVRAAGARKAQAGFR